MTADYDITIQRQVETDLDLPVERLLSAADWVLRDHGTATNTGLSIVITTDEAVRQLNRQFRTVDKPTDVLSFPADPAPVPEVEPYLGDLILALPYIRRQAATEGHTLSDELTLAVIHGTLHLLGYDHDTPENQAAMWSRQAQALAALDVAIIVPLFEFPDQPDPPDQDESGESSES